MIEPFRIAIAPEVMEDLRARLRATRWPRGVEDAGGIPLATVREIVRYWSDDFDWPAQERELNRLPQFKTRIDGLDIHFMHMRCEYADAPALLLVHGWPGSIVEMRAITPLLARSFHVVVPSLPGYGFSDAPLRAGMSSAGIAEVFAALMTRLDYERFVTQGGDWGASITTWLARRHATRVMGLHLNYIPGSYTPAVAGPLTDEEAVFLRDRDQWAHENGAYDHLQSTRPLTPGYALSDSPAGLAAWIVEKFHEWADPRSAVPLDAILANVTVYWATNTIAPSMRLYLECEGSRLVLEPGERIRVPCGIARFPLEAPFPPRSWIERAYDVVHWTDMPAGGHFAALEAPEALAADVVRFAGVAGMQLRGQG